ncbi:MAG: transcription termination factor NusA [candidate division KSB1 bacterium]|nr:transcription termination factor NusA [candidate division KSB1 bacterium]MDZ7275484.1 transcription termination factor NusA [candidate division KSB1 bacterium]MDZ7286204.1 transcription termination factor NusA [candidate division KSB1 bacterium]MDZ7296430.1 transcription termination factor NusA [candidate division KSB1 bacterium]MDZ7309275.1 transcription termination factor NusA [candidate division KSB1 bacterium]
MKSEIAEAFAQLIKEKNIDKDQLTEIVHSTVMGMIKKKYGITDNFDVYVNLDKGEIEIHQTKIIVEKVTDEVREIDLETARQTEPDFDVGDEYLVIIDPMTFGRRLITSAKQNLNQRIRDEEKKAISEEFETRIGEIVTGDIRQISRGDVFLNVERTEVILPRKEQIENERYRRGDNIRALVKEVRRTNRGPEIIVSRSDPKFLVRLFELEVPEIYDGIIEIKAVARQPGERSKIAVASNDKRIDAVGACVGMKGIRIQAVSKELNNEKVDVIPWSYDKEVFITRALSPAKPVRVLIDEPNNRAVAVLPDDQVSLGIGRGGQNRRLTSKLTGVEIEIMKESEYRQMVEAQRGKETPLEYVTGLSQAMLTKLKDAGLHTVNDVLKAGEQGLTEIKGIGEKTAEKIWALVHSTDSTAAPAAVAPVTPPEPESAEQGPGANTVAAGAEGEEEEVDRGELARAEAATEENTPQSLPVAENA